MDRFTERAVAILETAQAGGSSDIDFVFGRDGSLRMIVGESLAPGPAAINTAACEASFRLTRRPGRVAVSGTQGDRRCELHGAVIPQRTPLLLNQQVLYSVVVPRLLAAN